MLGLVDGFEKQGMGIHGQRAIYGASAGALAGVVGGLLAPGTLGDRVKNALVAGATGAAMGAGVGVGGGAIADKIVGHIDRGSNVVSQMTHNRENINRGWENLQQPSAEPKFWRGREV